MGNAFSSDISSPMQTGQEYEQTLAKTAMMQSEAAIEAVKAKDVSAKSIAESAFQQKVQQLSPGMEPLQRLSAAANLALDQGLFSEADNILSVMSKIDPQSAAATYKLAQAEDLKLKENEREWNWLGGMMQGVDSQQQFDLVKALYEREGFKGPDGKPKLFPLKNPDGSDVPYSPELKKMMDLGLKAQLQKAKIDTEVSRQAELKARADADKLKAETDKNYKSAKATETEKRDAANKKVGLKPPTKEDKATAAATIKNLFPGMDKDDLEAAAADASSYALERMRGKNSVNFSSGIKEFIEQNSSKFEAKPGSPGYLGGLFGKTSPTATYHSQAARASGTTNSADVDARAWAAAHRRDPRAKTILDYLGD